MTGQNHDPFAQAFTPGGGEDPTADSRGTVGRTPTPDGPSFGSVPSASPAPGAEVVGPTRLTKSERKARDAAERKADKADRKAAPSAGSTRAHDAAVEKKKQLSVGERYGGDRRKWLLLVTGVVVLPLITLAAFVTANSKPSTTDVEAIVDARLAVRGTQFPAGEAIMWAGQVVRVWGTWNEADKSGQRDILLSQYLSRGIDPRGGWNGNGQQEVIYSTVNTEPKITDSSHAWIEATYQIQDGTWNCVSLPVYAYHGANMTEDSPYAFALAANPVPVACAPRTGAPPMEEVKSADGATSQNDSASATELQATFFPGFFGAWAASDQATLSNLVLSGTTVIGLGGAFESTPPPEIGTVVLPVLGGGKAASGKTYTATVPVTWTVAGSTSGVTAMYNVGLKRQGVQWFVTGEPTPVVQQPGLNAGEPGDIASGQGGVADPLFSTKQPVAGAPKGEVTPTDGSGK